MITEIIIHPDELTKKQIDKAINAGVKILGIHPVGGKEAHLYLDQLISLCETDEFRALIDYAVANGLEIEYELHSAGYLLPRSLFSTSPQLFRTDEKGEKNADFNFCVSNEDALNLVSKNARSLANKLYKSRPVFNFWLDDGKNSTCNCDKCKSLSPSDQQLVALNSMIKEIRKDFPSATMPYLAYMDTILPPTSTKSEDGIFLEYAPFEKYTAKSDDAEFLIKREENMIAPLMDFFKADTYKVLEYWYDNSLFSHWKKPPVKFCLNESGMKKDIDKYKNLGFNYISTFACYLGYDYDELYDEVEFSKLVEFATSNTQS